MALHAIRTGASVLLVASLMGLGVASTAEAKAEKRDVCHRTNGANEYVLINVSVNAYETHIDHGDASPGDAVEGEGKFGTVFGADCSEVPPDASGDGLIWTSANGLAGIMTSFWVNGSENDAGEGKTVLTRPDETGFTFEAACVRFDGNEVNWGGLITASDNPADIGDPVIGWAWDNPNGADMIGFWRNPNLGGGDPCSEAALTWDGGGTVTSGEVIINQ